MKLNKLEIKKLNDVHKLVIAYVVAVAVFQVVFFAESFFVVAKTVAFLFWLFVLPGIGITYLWDLNFIERLALAVAISAATVGILSYYLGLAGLHVIISAVLLPLIFMFLGLVIIFRKKIEFLKTKTK